MEYNNIEFATVLYKTNICSWLQSYIFV